MVIGVPKEVREQNTLSGVLAHRGLSESTGLPYGEVP
jgi:hypothetical protein